MSKLPVLNMEFRKADSKMEPLVPVEVHFSYLRFTQTKREKSGYLTEENNLNVDGA